MRRAVVVGSGRIFQKNKALTVEQRFLCVLLLFLMLTSLFIGEVSFAWEDFIERSHLLLQIITELRLPRAVLAIEVGAALALSGAALQALAHNPLAEPSLTGASQGAALGAAFVFYYNIFPVLGVFALPLAALIGAFLSLFVLFFLAKFLSPEKNLAPESFILAGIALSALSGALLGAVLNFAPNPYAMQELVFWLLGSVKERGWEATYFLTPALILGAWGILKSQDFLSALSLGTIGAKSLGFQLEKESAQTIFFCALLVGAAVAAAGSIGFVGLIVPHLARKIWGENPAQILFPSALLGGALVLCADILLRILPGAELKLGILTALIGAPFFLFLLCQRRF